jgi:hypothetical protein
MLTVELTASEFSYWLYAIPESRHRRWRFDAKLVEPNTITFGDGTELTDVQFSIAIFEFMDRDPYGRDTGKRGEMKLVPGSTHERDTPSVDIGFYCTNSQFESFTSDLRSSLRLVSLSFDVDGLVDTDRAPVKLWEDPLAGPLRITTMIPIFATRL